MIPIELLRKYKVMTLEERNMFFPDLENNEECVYQDFLSATDHYPNKIFEELIENLATATPVNFITVFIDFIKDIRGKYKDILTYRKLSREEVSRLVAERTANN